MKWKFICIGLLLTYVSFCLPTIEANGEIIHTREVYKTIDSTKLKIDIFHSDQSFQRENNAAIVFFHGGGWAFGTPDEFFTTCERYAKMGIVTFSVEYRLSIENGVTPHKTISPIESVMDAKSAMRWVRENAERFHIDKNKIVGAGQSAGGQLVLATAMIDDYNEKTDNPKVSCCPDEMMLFSPCVCTFEAWCIRLLADRRDKVWSISPSNHIRKGLPPSIHFHGVEDEMVPFWTVEYFEKEMKRAGNYYELHRYEGKTHYLGEGNQQYSRYYNEDVLNIADDFLRKYKLLD